MSENTIPNIEILSEKLHLFDSGFIETVIDQLESHQAPLSTIWLVADLMQDAIQEPFDFKTNQHPIFSFMFWLRDLIDEVDNWTDVEKKISEKLIDNSLIE